MAAARRFGVGRCLLAARAVLSYTGILSAASSAPARAFSSSRPPPPYQPPTSQSPNYPGRSPPPQKQGTAAPEKQGTATPPNRPPPRRRRPWRAKVDGPVLHPQYDITNARFVKMIRGVSNEQVFDESNLYLKFNPLDYAKRVCMIRELPIPGAVNGETFWAVTEATKVLIRSLLLILAVLHKAGFCFEYLGLDSVLISGEGRFKIKKQHVLLKALGPNGKGIDTDYEMARVLIQALLVESCGQDIMTKISRDFISLFSLMKVSSKSSEYHIQTHVCLLPLSSWSLVFRKFYNEVRYVLGRDDPVLQRIVYSDIKYVGWGIKAERNPLLKKWLLYRPGAYDFDEAYSQLDLMRNVDAHQMDKETYPDGQLQFLLYATFPDVLSQIQNVLFRHGRIGHLHIEEDFNDGKSHILSSMPRVHPSAVSTSSSKDLSGLKFLVNNVIENKGGFRSGAGHGGGIGCSSANGGGTGKSVCPDGSKPAK